MCYHANRVRSSLEFFPSFILMAFPDPVRSNADLTPVSARSHANVGGALAISLPGLGRNKILLHDS